MHIPWWIKYVLLLVGLLVAYNLHSPYVNWGQAALATFGAGFLSLGVTWKRFSDKWWPFLIVVIFPIALPLVNDLQPVGPVQGECEVVGAYRTYHLGGHSRPMGRTPSLRPPALSLLCQDGLKYVSARQAPELLYRRGDKVLLKKGLLGFQRIWHAQVAWDAEIF